MYFNIAQSIEAVSTVHGSVENMIIFRINAGISHLVDKQLVADPRTGKLEVLSVSCILYQTPVTE